MRNVVAIVQKELQSYFVSPVAYVVATGFLVLTGFFFFSLVTQFQQLVSMAQSMGRHDMLEQIDIASYVVAPMLGNVSVILIFVVPLLTMRLIAEERKLRTDELLFTSPVTAGEIVAGKFLAAWILLMGMLGATWIYMVILFQYSEPDPGPILSGYLGIALLATTFAAVGLFASSLTESQVVAGVVSLVILLILYIVSWPADMVPGTLGTVLEYVSLLTHLRGCSRESWRPRTSRTSRPWSCSGSSSPGGASTPSGSADRDRIVARKRTFARIAGFSSVVMILFGIVPALTLEVSFEVAPFLALFAGLNLLGGVVALGLALAWNLDGILGAFRSQASRRNQNAFLNAGLWLGILVLLNIVASRHSVRWDWTEAGLFTLAPQTQKILEGLEEPLEIRAFYTDETKAAVSDLLDTYRLASAKVTIEYIDPFERPEIVSRYGITQERTLHLSIGTEEVRLTEPDEEKITNAVIKMTQTEERVVYVLGGHGEPDLDDLQSRRGYGYLKQEIENEQYVVRELRLMTEGEVPADASVVVAAGATRPYFPAELDALDRYLDGGGRLLALLEPIYDAGARAYLTTGIEELLERRGIDVGDDLVVEVQLRLFDSASAGTAPGAESYGVHEITEDFQRGHVLRGQGPPGAAGHRPRRCHRHHPRPDPDPGPGPRPTSPSCSRRGRRSRIPKTPGDRSRSRWLTSAATSPEEGEDEGADEVRSRIVVFGDAGFVDNDHAADPRLRPNVDLVLNCVAWLVDAADQISIRPKSRRASQLLLTPIQTQIIFVASVFLLPEILLLVGLGVWQTRR